MDEKQIRRKEIAAYSLMALLLLLSFIILFRMDYSRQLSRMQAQSRMKLGSVAEMIQYMESIRDSSITSFDARLQEKHRTLSRFQTELTAEDLFTGELPAEEGGEDRYAYLRSEEFLDIVKRSFNGILLLLSAADEQFPVIWQSDSLSDADRLTVPEITSKLIREQPRTVKSAGSDWFCTYSNIKNSDLELVFLSPLRAVRVRSIIHVALTEVTMLIIFVTILTYFFSVLKYSNSRQLTKLETFQYHPKNLHRKMRTAGLIGALVVFVSTAVFQTMDALHEESINGARGLSRLLEYIGETVSERMAAEKQKEEKWYAGSGGLIASQIAQSPETVTREQLQEYCDLFDIDYIMLFDTEGKETACSADYVGFTMDAGLGENSGDFRRLLLGVPAIVHDVSCDPITELERQFIGVRVPSHTRSGDPAFGALIMAVDPHMKSMEELDFRGQFHFLDKDNRLLFYTDQETGKILYASDSTLVGKTAIECGLPEKSLLDGYTDFATFNGVYSYVTTVKQKEEVFFYVIRSAALFSSTLPLASAALICYLLTSLGLGLFYLKEYNTNAYEALIDPEKQQAEEIFPEGSEDYSDQGFVPDFSELPVSKNRSDTRWEDKTPESRVGTILKIDVLLLVILPVLVYIRENGDSSLFRYIMNGNWMRGVNLFSFCAIVIVLILGVFVLVLCSGLLSMIAGITGRAGETACRMLYSLLSYLVFLSILYYIFEYTGLSLSTYIASLGVASLALSIGARGMVEDILAGVMIVFERQFQVGDYIEIDGCRGRVLDIGVRSTRILGDGNDVRFINNSNIRSVVNKSIRNTANTAEYNLITQKSLEQIEELFNRELPMIGQKSDDIIRGPVLDGLVKVSKNAKPGNDLTFALQIGYECSEQDQDKVKSFLTREIFLLCEREGIGLNFGMYDYPFQRRIGG